MFLFGKPKRNKELDAVLQALKMDAENNYKDAAQLDLKRLQALFAQKKESMNAKQREYYEEQLARYQVELAKFTHKDQKVTW